MTLNKHRPERKRVIDGQVRKPNTFRETMEKEIKITAKLYECRDSAKSMCKMQNVDFKETIEPYSHIIKQVMIRNNLKHLPALLRISETNMYQDSGMAQLLFMAALTELMEPSV